MSSPLNSIFANMCTSDLEKLTTDELAMNMKPILTELMERRSTDNPNPYNPLISRATEPAIIAAIISILKPHPGDDDRVIRSIRYRIVDSILIKLSFEQLQAYQSTIVAVNAQNTGPSKQRLDYYLDNMRRLERFMAEPEAVWVAEDWYDYVGFRTLADRVHTAEQMRPYMREMYNWFEDRNVSIPYGNSKEQLARFPDTATAVAAEFIDDVVAGKMELDLQVETLDHIVQFVDQHIPFGENSVLLRKSLKSLLPLLKENTEKGGQYICVYRDLVKEIEVWLSELNKWERDESKEEEDKED